MMWAVLRRHRLSSLFLSVKLLLMHFMIYPSSSDWIAYENEYADYSSALGARSA